MFPCTTQNTDPTELADAQLAAASLPSPSSGERELSVGSEHHGSGFLTQSGHFDAGLMSEVRLIHCVLSLNQC